MVILAVPFSNHREIVSEIIPVVQNKILIDTTVPLVPPRVARVQLPEFGSVARQTQEWLGKEVRVVSAFQNVAAYLLLGDDSLHGEILVFGNNKEAFNNRIDRYENVEPSNYEMNILEHNLGTTFYLGDLELYFEK